MNLQGVREGDVVECDVRGRIFFATVREKVDRKLRIRAITSGVTYTEVTARQVIAHYRRSRASVA